ncbi:C40 family peptidase [Lysobacter korlensis]|uniref:C40 family peptidase n=1 Tax=Lysobacter korlensis TaxID=553636 RepID=A0ABV6RK59_9GAMM
MLSTSTGRTAATASPARRAAIRFSLLLALSASSLGAFAQQKPTVAAPPIAVPAPQEDATATRRALPESMTLSDRALILATDLNRLLTPADAKPAGEGGIKDVLQRALGLLGTPYRWGGTSPDSGFDCSGLVGYVFRNALGIELPRVSREMAKAGELVSDRAALVEGDLVFFGKHGGEVDHVGIYVGNGKFVHAPRTGRDVTVSTLDSGYWHEKFLQARRVHGG